MSNLKDGGQAFPHDERARYGKRAGMTLRDYFAAKALATASGYSGEDLATWSAEDFARHAYAIADAMLSIRGV